MTGEELSCPNLLFAFRTHHPGPIENSVQPWVCPRPSQVPRPVGLLAHSFVHWTPSSLPSTKHPLGIKSGKITWSFLFVPTSLPTQVRYTRYAKNKSTSVSHSTVSDSLRPQGLEPARPLCPWDSPGTNTGVMPFPSPGDPPNPGIELPSPASPASQVISLPTVPSGNQFTPGSQLKESSQSVLWSNSLSYPILVPRKQCTHVCCPDFITGIRGEIKTKLLNCPLLVINMLCLGISLAVQELRLCLPKQRVWIWSLVGSVRSHMPCGQNTKMRNRSSIVTSIKTLKWTILKIYIF